MRKMHIAGIVASVASATPTDVFSGGAGLFPFPAAAAATTIVSGSANDATAGTGALTVRVTGLDANFNDIMETVSMNGATPVSLANQYLRVTKVEVLTAGSDGTNDGIISVKQSSTVIAAIAASAGRSQMAIYTGSARYAGAAIKKMFCAITSYTSGGANFQLLTRKNGGVWQIRHIEAVAGQGACARDIEFVSPIYIAPGEDVRVYATSTANSTGVAAGFNIEEGSSDEMSNYAVV